MTDKALFALEKIMALVTSQRTLSTIVGVIVIVVLVQNAVIVITGGEAWEYDEEALAANIGELLAVVATVITAAVSVLQLTKANIDSIKDRPPTLSRTDYEA